MSAQHCGQLLRAEVESTSVLACERERALLRHGVEAAVADALMLRLGLVFAAIRRPAG